MNTNNNKYLALMFDRPQEPLFAPKGPHNAVFRVPQSYLPDRYKPLGMQLSQIFDDEVEETIYIKEIELPDVGELLKLDRNGHFSLFVPWHQELAADLITKFIDFLLGLDCDIVAVEHNRIQYRLDNSCRFR
ncbi:hypothetical protein FQR65_LT15039 [Abscondita terminalis]|nr:hypothetical protein FQR65_LT15039 [Abscondita terminalis]